MNSDQALSSSVNSRWITFVVFSAFAVTLFGIKLWLISTYGNATPFWDQWDAEAAYLYKPFLEGTLRWADLFVPHNEHRILTTRLLALALLAINRTWNPLLQMVVNAGLHITGLVFCIAWLTRAIGRKYLPTLLIFSLVLFGIPYAWENTLAGFQSQFYFVIFFSIASLWLTTTRPPLSFHWWSGVACAILAFLSLASGIFSLAASATVGLLFYLFGLRKTPKQLVAVVILASLFIFGAALTPSLAYHAYLKAASLRQFLSALTAILSWPMSSKFFSVLIRNLPVLIFVGLIFRKRPPPESPRWFLLVLAMRFPLFFVFQGRRFMLSIFPHTVHASSVP